MGGYGVKNNETNTPFFDEAASGFLLTYETFKKTLQPLGAVHHRRARGTGRESERFLPSGRHQYPHLYEPPFRKDVHMSCSAKVRRCLMEYLAEESWPDFALRYALAEDETIGIFDDI